MAIPSVGEKLYLLPNQVVGRNMKEESLDEVQGGAILRAETCDFGS